MNKNIQRFIDLATTKKQSHYIDPSMMNPKPIFTENGQPKTYDDFDKEKFALLICQKCINIIEQSEGDLDWAIFKIRNMFDE